MTELNQDNENASPPKRFRSVSVEGLFGHFNHTVSLQGGNDIVIVTAPNGYGKTAILRILDHFFNGRFRRLSSYLFSSIAINFDDASSIVITRNETQNLFPSKEDDQNNQKAMSIAYLESGIQKEVWLFDRSVAGTKPSQLPMIERLVPQLDRISPTLWYDMTSDETLELEEVMELYGDRLPENFHSAKVPDWLQQIVKGMNCRLIETQRLMAIEATEYIEHRYRRSGEVSSAYVVEKHAKNLAKQIDGKQKEYASVSQSLDQTFPHRILALVTKNPPPIDETNLRERIQLLEQKRADLVEAGLIKQMQEIPALPKDEISGDVKVVLDLYIEDTSKKLALFRDLNDKISVFKQILNERYRFKKVAVNQNDGIEVVTDEGTHIPLNSLSSGEQHELVLLYELLFSIGPNSLVLIDEPEISLHVAWQKRFLPDLDKVIRLSGFQAVIATHSPQIINDRWDLTVELQPAEK